VATRKKKSLVIVESPAKAKTINKYLGTDFEVAASKGHVRDLPTKKFGINIDKGWLPTYQLLEDRKPVLADLKKKAQSAGTVYLAPDPDREGEAIAWHLKEALELKDDRVRRVTFNEITKKAIQEAFENPGEIDKHRVAAQEARRFLDRVVGYKLSPLLSKKVARGLSAGRVQSVAVRLIVDREREIQKFVKEEYWKITAMLAPAGKVKLTAALAKDKPAKGKGKGAKDEAVPPAKDEKPENEDGEPIETTDIEVPEGAFLAELAEWDGKKFESTTQDDTQKVVDALQGANYVVAKVEQKDRQEKPSAPFTTSTMQQQASIRLRFSARQTMMFAQRLYEGVELGSEGSVALITYMRTDSTRVSNDALAAVRDHIQKEYGKPYLPEKPNAYTSGKSAQEAHEAVRPTDLSYTPEKVAKFLPRDELRLYTLIYNRFVASQMMPAVFAITNVEVQAAKGLFKAQGKVLKFDGFRKVLAPVGKQEDAEMPALSEKQALDLLQLTPTQHFTQPPGRFSEASLVKALEKEGIGRPSTYAAIIGTIQKRGYVDQKERRFFATELGMTVTDLLVQHFPKEMDLKFTSHMEEELDQIEARKVKRNDVLNEFFGHFSQALKTAETKMEAVKGVESGEMCPKCGKPLVKRFSKKSGTSFLGCSGYKDGACDFTKPIGDEPGRPAPEPTDIKCPTCEKPMLKRMGPRGPFLGCSGYPECTTKMTFDAEGKPVLAARPTEHVCEKCGKPMILREGPRGPFLGCSGYPKCRNLKDVDAQGNPLKPIDTGVNCEKCGAPMAVKRGPRGPFLGCSSYPKCRSTKPMPPELKEKLKDLLPPPPPKKNLPAVEINDPCPECGGPMALRESRRGRANFFLGCKKYPKCKGTREAPAEVLEQLQESGAV
jgi:DNA topoisomerase-1